MTNSLAQFIKSPHDGCVDDLLLGLSFSEQTLIREAFDWAKQVYGDRLLPMGGGVFTHTVGVARQATMLNMDATSRVAALLSRLPSFLPTVHDDVRLRFGNAPQQLIDGLEKLRLLDHTLQNHSLTVANKGSELQAEALRKMLLVLANDVRMVTLKLICRLQTLRHIYKHPTDSAREVAFATLHFFAPLANRLGRYDLKWPLEDWSFRIIEPKIYQQLAQGLRLKRATRETLIQAFLAELTTILNGLGIKGEIKGRAKHLYSIHRKMQRKAISINDLYDLHAARVLVDDVEQCYSVLASVHSKWSFVQKEFDDYIAKPKENGYQSLHTVVVFQNVPIEVQIRTHTMHAQAESGVASHWRYKEGVSDDARLEERLQLLRELMDWQKDIAVDDQRLKLLTEDTIYCLTPKGQVYDLSYGATPVDFAYRVHTDLGHRCRGVRIDGALMPLSTPLKSGQCIDIITAKEGGPSRDWLLAHSPFIKTHRARSKVRQWFNAHEQEERINEGRATWLRMQSRLRPMGKAAPSGDEVATALGFNELKDFYLAMSRGLVGMHQLQALVRGHDASVQPPSLPSTITTTKTPRKVNKSVQQEGYSGKVSILDIGDMAYQKAECCTPLPPHAIIGYITRNNVVSIHRADCRELWHISNRLPERVIAVAWKRDHAYNPQAEPSSHFDKSDRWVVEGKSAYQRKPPFLAEVMGALQNGGYLINAMNFEEKQDSSSSELTPMLSFSLSAPPEHPPTFVKMLLNLASVASVCSQNSDSDEEIS